ncbi:plasmid mobilization relaxosome protein MobC [Pseudomonas lactis]|uniref:MobC family plasmid mobilization relaxosome protein n=6 Tax=Pseudomonas TaxID=286 RepID=A0ABR6T8H0_9PSED|nr:MULTISPECIES: plasmid mobilization relaxosome protein MobC [Pseudomonas]AVX90929.1 plasmid mobilization relaxosome protein MobC [Pseudomonas koreensis]EKT4463182.1 plasmid mobilization relaxosome protein MobC [Pseudomonas putida]MCF5512294.1 plasmid mobilization relaxosome protein MobC [Pseudomonas sp. PA-3-6H]MEB0053283.1 plasmid mobilization relaxosome protein MobC [Pseudomonas sp. FG1]RZN97250.1 plasmid mobilization relaxosome protein MobC [Pseudomonas moorei]HCF9838688.1 plasmid mobili
MSDKERKSNQLNFRLPKDDIQLLETQRAALKMTQVKFISHIINNGINEVIEVCSPKLREDIVTIEKIFSQIGNNLNQIAAALNSGKQPNQDILDVLSKLDKNMGVLTNRLESLKKEKITIKGDI